MPYYKRIADEVLEFKLKTKGAVQIVGPKWCGKTETAKQIAKSAVFMKDLRNSSQYIQLAKLAPDKILEGEIPHLIDEWQTVPSLWEAVKYAVDERQAFGQFILTGSVTLPKPEHDMHTGTGRITTMRMRPFSLFESGDSSGAVSLKELFAGEIIGAVSELDLSDYAFLVCRGGWPMAIHLNDREVELEQAISYVEALVELDISSDGKKRDSDKSRKLLRSYSRHLASQASQSTIARDLKASEGQSIDEGTLRDYLTMFRNLYVIEELEAWTPNIRSKARIQSGDTRHFTDPSIATAALGVFPEDLLNDLNSFGLFFESMCIRDLRTYADALKGSVYHYRDSNGLEADAVLHLRNGVYGLIEIKLGTEESIETGAANLKKIAALIDTDKMKSPSFLMVLTASKTAYKREDGVYVVPLGCLAP